MKDNRVEALEKCCDLVYLLAPSHSGSTLLTFLLSTHKSIATVGELKALRYDRICSCGLPLRECDFWKMVSEEVQGICTSYTLDDFKTQFRANTFLCDRLLHTGIRGRFLEAIRDAMLQSLPRCRHSLCDILEWNRKIIKVICHLQQGEMFLDGSKEAIRLKLLNSANFWNLKVIYLIRDGRGVVNSYVRKGFTVEIAAKEWRRTHWECDRIIQGLRNDTYVIVHYEDLCRDPQKTMDKIYAFLGLNPHLGDLRFKSFEHHILGNRMRLGYIEEIRIDEQWKSRLTKTQLEVFEHIAGRLNRRYGYH